MKENQTRQNEQQVQTYCLLVLTAIAMAGAFYWLKPVMIPFILAMLLTYAIGPVVDLLVQRIRIPRWLAIIAALVLGFLLFTLLVTLISSSASALAANAQVYEKELGKLIDWLRRTLSGMGIEMQLNQVQNLLAKVPVGQLLTQLTNGVVETLSNTFLVLIFAIYLLQGRNQKDEHKTSVRAKVDRRIKRYLGIKTTLSAVTGVLTGLILFVLGIDLAIVFGVLAFLFNFVPSIGSIVATLLPIPIILISPDAGVWTLVLALVLVGAVQIYIGNGLEPRLMGASLDLHPITVLLSLILWGMIWGVVGMVLATPITAVLRILFEEYEHTRPVAHIMAGNPAQ